MGKMTEGDWDKYKDFHFSSFYAWAPFSPVWLRTTSLLDSPASSTSEFSEACRATDPI